MAEETTSPTSSSLVGPAIPPKMAEVGEPPESPPWGLTVKSIVSSVAIILGALVVWRFQFLIAPLVVAAILAYLLNPLINWFQGYLALKRSHAVLIIYLAVLFLWVAGGVYLGLIVVDQGLKLRAVLPGLIPEFIRRLEELAQSWSAVTIGLGPYQVGLDQVLDYMDLDAIADQARTSIQPLVSRSGTWLAGIAQSTLSTVGLGLLVFVISIYISNDAPRLGRGISDLAHQPGYRKDADRMVDETLRVWNAYLRGQIILAVVIGVVVSIALMALGVNNALALGALSGLLEFLPIIGPVVGTVAAVLVALFQNSNIWGLSPVVYALVVLGVMVAIQQLENNLLVPRIVGDALDLHPIVVMVAVLMGSSLAGLLGAVLAAPVAASLKLYGNYIWRKLLDLPPFADEAESAAKDAVVEQRKRPSWWARLTQANGKK